MHDGLDKKKPAATGSIAALFGMKAPEPKPKLAELKKSVSSFYVHEMLATFRNDPIPPFSKERHVH